MKTTGDQQLVKRINRSLLLRLVRENPGLSRAQLAVHSSLTKSTVGQQVAELIADGWLTEGDPASASNQGRPSTPLHIDNQRRGLLGVEIAIDCLRLVWTSLQGDVRFSTQTALPNTAPAAVCQQVALLVVQAHRLMLAAKVQLTGIGVGLPGAFDESTGMVRSAPNLGWRDIEIRPLLLAALAKASAPAVSLYVQNEADTAALSEYEFVPVMGEDHFGANDSSLVFVNCDVGVGAGIVLNDRLFTGAQGMAGEIGHSTLQIGGLLCSCGRHGCAETLIGAKALENSAKSAVATDQSGHYLGVLLHNLWCTFNPHILVVGGPTCVGQPVRVQAAQATLDQYAHSAGMTAPRVRVARYGVQASAVGAAALVLHRYLRPIERRENRQRARFQALAPEVQPEQTQPSASCAESC